MSSQKLIKLTVLGCSRSGKTTLTAATYAALSTAGRNKFFMFAENPDDGLRLQQAARAMRKGEAPRLNAIGDFLEYEFNLNFQAVPICNFRWIDYRGGALEDASGVSADVPRLRERVRESDALFVILSGEHLRSPVFDWDSEGVPHRNSMTDDVEDNAGIGGIQTQLNELQKIRAGRAQNYLPVVIVLTKSDLCMKSADNPDGRPQSDIVADVRALFPMLFPDESSQKPLFKVLICPTRLGQGYGSPNDLSKGKYDPKWIHWPFLFVAYELLRQNYVALKKARSQGKDALAKELDKGFFRKIFGEDRSAILRMEIQDLDSKIDKIRTDLQLIATEVDTREIYEDGENVGKLVDQVGKLVDQKIEPDA